MTIDRRAALVERMAKTICREKCSFYGEPPCFDLGDEYVQETWPPDCGEPGCIALADAALDIALEEAARIVRRMPSPSSEWMADELLRALNVNANSTAAIRAALAAWPGMTQQRDSYAEWLDLPLPSIEGDAT